MIFSQIMYTLVLIVTCFIYYIRCLAFLWCFLSAEFWCLYVFNGVFYAYCCKPEYIKEEVWKLPICLTKTLAFSIYWNWINIPCSHLSYFRFCYQLSTLHLFPLKSFTETLTDICCFVLKIDKIIFYLPLCWVHLLNTDTTSPTSERNFDFK